MGLRRVLIHAAATATTILSFAPGTAAQTERRSAVSQETQQPDVVAWLGSRDPRLEAWGAWFAGIGQLRNAAPLIEAVVRERLRAPAPANATLDIALDALIQLQVPLDRDLLREVYAVRPAQALIAASFTRNSDAFLDEIIESAKGHAWLAAANLLLARAHPRFVSRMLSGLSVQLTVFLVDAGNGIAGGGGIGMGCGVSGSAPGMPPWATYQLTSFPAPGVSVLAMGPTPMYYRRTVAPAGLSPAGSTIHIGAPTGHDRLIYAAAAAGIESTRLPLRGAEHHSISVQSDADLAGAVERLRTDLARRYDMFLRMLVERGVLLDDAVVTRSIQVDVAVQDHRTQR